LCLPSNTGYILIKRRYGIGSDGTRQEPKFYDISAGRSFDFFLASHPSRINGTRRPGRVRRLRDCGAEPAPLPMLCSTHLPASKSKLRPYRPRLAARLPFAGYWTPFPTAGGRQGRGCAELNRSKAIQKRCASCGSKGTFDFRLSFFTGKLLKRILRHATTSEHV